MSGYFSESSSNFFNIYLNFKRQALHARNLSFVHPITLENKSFQTRLPSDFQKLETSFSELY